MLLFRSILFTIVMIITIPFWAIPGSLLYPFPYKVRYGFLCTWAKTMVRLLKYICNLDYKIEGAENIPPVGDGCIVFCKHQSAWETIALQDIFPEQIWVLKRELLWVPFFGWALKMMECVAIDRSSGRKAVQQIVEQGTDRLKKGRCVVVFPEGTRVAPGQVKKFGVGGAILAVKSGFPIIPVAHNAGEYWRRRGMVKYPGTIRVVIGKPIASKGRDTHEINEEAQLWMQTTMQEITTLDDSNHLQTEST